ncbi:hypothetical protein Sm713_53000 [Streptomyces sp. TS71-3]|nr:hypothetical protein Sm713_53000 [Streptomyces sp. TS71-3]
MPAAVAASQTGIVTRASATATGFFGHWYGRDRASRSMNGPRRRADCGGVPVEGARWDRCAGGVPTADMEVSSG